MATTSAEMKAIAGLPGDAMLDEDMASVYLGVGKAVLKKLRKDQIEPPYVAVPAGVCYRKADLDAWMQSNQTGLPIKKP